MKFLGQSIQKLEPEQDRQTDRHTERVDRTHYHAAFDGGITTSNVTTVTEVRSASGRLFAGVWRPLVSIVTTLYYVAIIFHRRVWYRAHSLCYACIRSSGIILIPYRLPFCQISFFSRPPLLS